MKQYRCRQEWKNRDGEQGVNIYTLQIVNLEDEFRVVNTTFGGLWKPVFHSYEEAKMHIYALRDTEIVECDINWKEEAPKHQYVLPARYSYLADEYPNVTWQQALDLYILAVQFVILTNNEKNLYSGSLCFGKGIVQARNKFNELLAEADKNARKNS